MGHAERLCISPDVKAETSDMLRTVFAKMGSLPWETEGAGKPASTQLNVVLIWKAQRDFFFLTIVSHSSAPGVCCSAHLEPGGSSEIDSSLLSVTQLQLGSSLTLPLLRLKQA